MLRQYADSPFVGKISRSASSVGGFFARVPLSVWRNVVLFLLLVWICHSLASLFWQLMPSPNLATPKVVAAPVSVTTNSSKANSVDVNAIVELKLFGDAAKAEAQVAVEPEPSQIVDDNLEETKLNLKLHAVVASSDQKAARAIIANGSTQELYRIDEEVISNVKLAKILSQRVVLNNKGRLESLWLYSEEEEKLAQSRESSDVNSERSSVDSMSRSNNGQREPSAVPSRPANSNSNSVSNRNTRPSSSSKPKSNSNSSSNSSQPRKVVLPRAQIVNTKSIADALRFSLHRVEGELRGVRLRPGRDRTLFDQAGLQANDVVTSVNGIQMNDVAKMRSVMQELKTATAADLEIMRGEELLNISISVN